MNRDRDPNLPPAIRIAERRDIPELVTLLEAYMRETFGTSWGGSTASLERDGFGAQFRTVVATGQANLAGFAGWRPAYDLHHCVSGGEVIDMYVVPHRRARGIAAQLLATVASEVLAAGGAYLAGQAVQRGVAKRMYSKYAMSFPGPTCVLGGRAFREFARLAGASPRVLAGRKPSRELNFEP